MSSSTQEAVQEAAAVHCGHSEELQGLLLEEEVPGPPLGSAHLPETCARPAGPPGLQPAAGGEEEEGGGGALQEAGGGDGEVGWSSQSSSWWNYHTNSNNCCSHANLFNT